MQVTYDCLICADPCCVVGVFSCGHYTCITCALRITVLSKGGCPVCREKGGKVIATRRRPVDEDGFDVKSQFGDSSSRTPSHSLILCQALDCLCDGEAVREYVSRFSDFVCPLPCCWSNGEQEPFSALFMLQEHLRVDHKLNYCDICIKNRPAFLSEQIPYTEHEMDQHQRGTCKKDPQSFLGHPACRFCSVRFYDGDQLLKHMQHSHFSCDVCNVGEFTFTYYKNRSKLIEHFERCHKLCDHVDCSNLDPMLRVFRSDIELQAHKQRAHGQAARGVALASLGFRFSVTDPAAPSTSGGSSGSSGPNAGGLAAGGGSGGDQANQQAASIITFDHVSRREHVDMFPTTVAARNGKGHQGRRGGKGQQQLGGVDQDGDDDEDRPSVEDSATRASRRIQGVPSHYLSRKLHFDPILQPVSHVTSTAGTVPERDGAEVKPSAFFQSATANMTKAGSTNGDPKSPQKTLEEHLRIMNPKLLADFRYYSGEFLAGKVLAAEYYDALAKVFFTKTEAFEAVFPLLVGTIPIETKREALVQVRRMRTAPEVLRHEKVREEEELKARQREVAQAVREGRNKPKPKIWGQSGSPQAAATAAAAQAQQDPKLEDAAPRGQVAWGGRSAPPNSLPPVHVDPSDFPTLPGSSHHRRGHGGPHHAPAPTPKKGNVWFTKNTK